jgi:RarD protein
MKNKGFIEMLSATLIWGSVPLFAVWCSLPSPIFIMFRVLFAFPFVFFYSIKLIGKKELFRPFPLFPLVLSGAALALNWIFLFWAIQKTSIGNAIILYYLGPVITILLSVVFLREPFNRVTLISIVLAFLGGILIFLPQSNGAYSYQGLILALISGIFYGLLGFFSKIGTKYHSAIKITTYQIFISILFTLPFGFFMHFEITYKILLLLIISGVVHTALALFLWYDSLSYISITSASILSYLDPFFAIILSFLFLQQVPVTSQIIGGILITISGIIVPINEKRLSIV